MAATDPNGSRALAALTGAALALPGMTPTAQGATPASQLELEGGIYYYDEGSGRVTVRAIQQGLITPLGDDLDLSLNLVRDSISGASPVYNVPELSCPGGVTIRPREPSLDSASGASGGPSSPLPQPLGGRPYTETACQPTAVQQILSTTRFADVREAVDLKLNRYLGDMTLGLGLGFSEEIDYSSHYLNLDLRRELNDKHTTLAMGVGLADDQFSPVNQPGFTGDKQVWNGLLGVTQVLDKYSLAQVNLTYADGSGYLTDPYKEIYVLSTNSTQPEQRPDHRGQWNLLGRYTRWIPDLGGALHFDYRYSWDDWGISAHTLDASWSQPLGDGWSITPGVRYYSQTAADFYQDYFSYLPDDGIYSSDYRLAGFGALSYRLKLSKSLGDNIRLDAGVEYYDRRDGLALENSRGCGCADYDYLTVSLGWKLLF